MKKGKLNVQNLKNKFLSKDSPIKTERNAGQAQNEEIHN